MSRVKIFSLWVALAAGAPLCLRAVSDERQEKVVLPPFVVTQVPDAAPWQYARVADFEVLTLCPDEFTQRFVEAQARGVLFLPQRFQGERTEPAQIVLFSNRNEIVPSARGTTSNMERWGASRGRSWWSYPGVLLNRDAEQFALTANFLNFGRYESVTAYCAAHRLATCTPPAPLWLREGLFGERGLFPGVQGIQAYTVEDVIRLPRLEWFDGDEFPTNRRADLRIQPLAGFFATPPAPAGSTTAYRNWCLQAGLFVHWALHGQRDLPAAAEAFWTFAAQAQQRSVTEQLFSQHFGLTYREAEEKLRWHLVRYLDMPLEISVPTLHDPLPQFADFKLRPATEAEVARLKGNFERMEAARLRADFPELAARYEAAARRTLQRGMKRGGADPSVRAVLGLLEYDTGHPNDARPHLDAAFAAGAAGTRALVALARLRLADMRIGLPPEGKLPAEALDRVLTPLYRAKDRRPADLEVYRLIGEVWGQSAVPPKRTHLAVLLEGAELFPDSADLLWLAADLHRRHGFETEVDAIARRGLRLFGDPVQRGRFAALLAEPTSAAGK